MAKAFVHINKIKNYGALKSRWNHDLNTEFRKQHVANADPDRNNDNDILVACTDEDGNEISYEKAVKNRIKGKKQPHGRNIRKDAVIAYDIVLEFGDADDIESENIDVEEWERRSVEWLKETFNVAGDGKDNVISVVCHKDESSPHIHAVVTPVNEDGNLCAKSFTGGAAALSRFQDAYAAKLEDLGIERGTRGSSAHQKSNRKYNAEKKAVANIPDPEPGQTAEEYVRIYREQLMKQAIAQKARYDKLERQLRARNDEERILQKRMTKDELESVAAEIKEETEKYEQQLDYAKKQAMIFRDEIQQLSDEKIKVQEEFDSISKAKTKANLYDYQQKVMAYTKTINPELANDIENLYKNAEDEFIDAQAVKDHNEHEL